MAWELLNTPDGETISIPLELPIFDGDTTDICEKAQVSLASTLRHAAVLEWMSNNLDLEDPEVFELYGQEHDKFSAKLCYSMIALASLSDRFDVDIMQEIWETPWES